MDILDYLAIWRRRWKIVVAATLLGVAIAAIVSALTQPEYVAKTRLFVTTTGGASVVEAYQGNLFGQERVQSYVRLATGKQVAQRTIDQLKINLSPQQLQAMTKAEVVPNSVLMDISVTNPNPTLARDLANAVALQTTQLVEELETSARGGSPAAMATVVDDADIPQSPTPKWIPNLLFGLAGGLMVGLAAAVARDKLDHSVHSLSEAADAGGAAPMGSVPREPLNAAGGIPFGPSHREASESFRSMRTNLLAAADSDANGAVIVAGPTTAVSTAPVTLGLGAALAEAGISVVTVDANFREKAVTDTLELSDRAGLSDVLANACPLASAVLTTGTTNLSVLPAGKKTDNPSELLAGNGMIDVLKSLCNNFEYVLIDGASMLPYSDTLTVAEWADGVLLVARTGSTTDSDLAKAAENARMARARIIGVTVT